MLPKEEKQNTIDIRLLALHEVPMFSKLRNDIDKESQYLIAKKGERKGSSLYSILTILINRKRTNTFIAFDDTKAIGYLSLVFAKFKKYRGNAYLVIALKSTHRGRGIGNQLMDVAEKFAKSHGKRRIELEVFAKNTNAIELYKKRGYLTEGVKKNAVQDEDGFDDVLIMTKDLTVIS